MVKLLVKLADRPLIGSLRITLGKSVLTIRELNWNQRFRDKKTKLNICHHMVTSSTQLQNSSFHVAEERERLRYVKNENCTCKACKTIVFPYQICSPIGTIRSLKNHDNDGKRTSQICIFDKENSTFARFARAFFVFLHFADVLVLSTT